MENSGKHEGSGTKPSYSNPYCKFPKRSPLKNFLVKAEAGIKNSSALYSYDFKARASEEVGFKNISGIFTSSKM